MYLFLPFNLYFFLDLFVDCDPGDFTDFTDLEEGVFADCF